MRRWIHCCGADTGHCALTFFFPSSGKTAGLAVHKQLLFDHEHGWKGADLKSNINIFHVTWFVFPGLKLCEQILTNTKTTQVHTWTPSDLCPALWLPAAALFCWPADWRAFCPEPEKHRWETNKNNCQITLNNMMYMICNYWKKTKKQLVLKDCGYVTEQHQNKDSGLLTWTTTGQHKKLFAQFYVSGRD